MTIARTEISSYRKRLRRLLNKIDKLAFMSTSSDPLIQGTPGEVFRQCGKKNCKCTNDPANRHGPYRVIQVYQKNKQKQISLRKEEYALWEQARDYQKQIKYLLQMKRIFSELTDLIQCILNRRVTKWPLKN